MPPVPDTRKDEILSACIAHILESGKDKDGLVQLVAGKFSMPEDEAMALAEQALSIHALVVGVTGSLAKGASRASVTRRLEDAGVGHDAAERIVSSAAAAIRKTRAKAWRKELQIGVFCIWLGVVLFLVFGSAILTAFCFVGGYYVVRGLWHFWRSRTPGG